MLWPCSSFDSRIPTVGSRGRTPPAILFLGLRPARPRALSAPVRTSARGVSGQVHEQVRALSTPADSCTVPAMNILITGGAGFIGSHTADALLAKGHHVRVLDSLEEPVHRGGKPPKYLSPEVEFIRGDVRDEAALLAALRGM